MAILEYLNYTVPDVVKKSVNSFYSNDPLFNDLRSKGKVIRSGGTEVQFVHIISGHSDISRLDASNHTIPLAKRQTLTTATGNWAWHAKPIIISHIDRDRMQSPDQLKRHIQDMSEACIEDFRNEAARQIYLGNSTELAALGSLNGAQTTLLSSGFTNGALKFDTPTQQAVGATTYLNRTRTEDLTNLVNNWYNQFGDAAAGTDAIPVMCELKRKADSFAREGSLDMLIVGFSTYTDLEDEVLAYPGGGTTSAIQYSADDIAKGKAAPPVEVVRGMRIYTNRWMDSLASVASVVDPIYGLNTSDIQWWVNAGKDFKVTKFNDLSHMGEMVDAAFVHLECQFAVRNLLTQACAENV